MNLDLDQLDVALLVGKALEACGCQWMIGGSVATSAYGEPRATHDVDLVANLTPAGVRRFTERLEGAFYADERTILRAAQEQASFNVIHFDTAEKIDVFCVGSEPFSVHGLRTRVSADLGDGRIVPVASPDHMVVEKLRWYRRGGEVSDRQWRDVQGVLQISGAELEVASLRDWAQHLGVLDLLERALREAGMDG